MTIALADQPTALGIGLPGKLSPTGLALPDRLTYDEWEAIGATLKTIRDSSLRWWWGDWISYGEHRYGEKYSQAIEAGDFSYGGFANAVYVCTHVAFSRRRENLSFSHHQEVASLTPDEQDMWLADAEANGWGVHALRAMIAQTKAQPVAPPRPTVTETRPLPIHPDNTDNTEETDLFSGGDWDTPVAPAPTPFALAVAESLATDGTYRENVLLEQYHAVMQRLLAAAQTGRDLVRHIEHGEMAQLLTEEDAKTFGYVADLLEWLQRTHTARLASASGLRRIK